MLDQWDAFTHFVRRMRSIPLERARKEAERLEKGSASRSGSRDD